MRIVLQRSSYARQQDRRPPRAATVDTAAERLGRAAQSFASSAQRIWQDGIAPLLREGVDAMRGQVQKSKAFPLLHKRQRRLRVAETVSLGDKRFVSILEVDGQSFLVGSSGANIALLASLATPEPAPFQRVLCDSMQGSERR